MRPLLCYLHSGPRPGAAGGPRFSGRGSRFRAGKLQIGAYAAKAVLSSRFWTLQCGPGQDRKREPR